jgi:hypothetical protein
VLFSDRNVIVTSSDAVVVACEPPVVVSSTLVVSVVEDWRMVVLAWVVGTVCASWLVNTVVAVTDGVDTSLVEEVVSPPDVVVASVPRVVVPSDSVLSIVDTL